MTIEFNEQLVGIWYVAMTASDFMAALSRRSDGKLDMKYRFRYYESGAAFDSGDRKNWYSGVLTNEVKAVKTLHEMSNMLASMSGGKCWELLRGTGTFDDFVTEFQALPWVHSKQVSAAEYERMTAPRG